jgi:heat shock transcription factor
MDQNMAAAFGDSSFYDYAGSLGAAGGQPTHNRVVSLEGLEGMDRLNDVSAAGADVNSTQLVRRNPNNQLAARGRTPWEAFNTNEQQLEWQKPDDEDVELEAKAAQARKEAQGKRKSIPPFVQKLSR